MSKQKVLIEWADAYAHEGSWIFLSDIVDEGEYLVESIGFLIEPGEGGQTGHLTIAQSLGKDNAGDHIINIPLGMVRKVSLLDDEPLRLVDFLKYRKK